MKFHYQNLNDRIPKNYLSHGRCWLGPFGAEWAFPSESYHLKLELGTHDENAIQFSIAAGLFALYLSYRDNKLYNFIQNKTKRKNRKYGNGRSIGFSIHDGIIWIDLWNDPMEWDSLDPKWWTATINIKDRLLGKANHSSTVLETRDVEIPMPEGAYNAHVKLCADNWERARWFTKVVKVIHIELDKPIPYQGKGENSYDCGIDGTYSFSSAANSIAEGVGKFVGSTLERRVKYGGWGDWNFQRKER